MDAWRSAMARAYRSVAELHAAGLLTSAEAAQLSGVEAAYQIRVPRYYADLIDRHAPERCPIRLQALPSLNEQDPELPPWAEAWSRQVFGRPHPWVADAIGDLERLVAPRLTLRYGNRALLHVTPACALYCRFCFRKAHLNDEERVLYAGSLDPALEALTQHPEVRELILTGGDPLALTDVALERLFDKLAAMPHIRQVRLHSRMAVTLPMRLTEELAALCARQPFTVAMVAHFNHPRELTAEALAGLTRMRRRGVPLYNQAVLLAGINDHVDVLAELFQTLYEAGTTPFYLHHPDWTPGTFQFRLPIVRGQELMQALGGRLSGPALPHYVLDLPGGFGKVRLMEAGAAQLMVRQADGRFAGALYRVRPPHTRVQGGAAQIYLDLWRQR